MPRSAAAATFDLVALPVERLTHCCVVVLVGDPRTQSETDARRAAHRAPDLRRLVRRVERPDAQHPDRVVLHLWDRDPDARAKGASEARAFPVGDLVWVALVRAVAP